MNNKRQDLDIASHTQASYGEIQQLSTQELRHANNLQSCLRVILIFIGVLISGIGMFASGIVALFGRYTDSPNVIAEYIALFAFIGFMVGVGVLLFLIFRYWFS